MNSIMKKAYKFLLGALAIASLASCDQKAKYVTLPYLVFEQNAYNINEDCGTLEVGVKAYNLSTSTTFAFDLGGTAVSGDDYTIAGGQSATLTLTPEQPSGKLSFDIIFSKEETGTRTIEISASNATETANLPTKSCKVNIMDVLVIDWDYVARKWYASDYVYPSGDAAGDEYEVVITKSGDNRCVISNLWGGGEDLNATVTFAEDTKSAVISIDKWQVIYNSAAYGPCVMLWGDGGSIANKAIDCVVDGRGIHVGGPDYGHCYYVYITTGDNAGYGLSDMTFTELAKKSSAK